MNEKYLVFQIANVPYCTPISSVLGVSNLDTVVKTTRSEMKISLWANRSLPVLDIISLTSIQESNPTKSSRIVVVDAKGFKVGFLVDSISGIEEFKSTDVREAAVSEQRFIAGYILNNKLLDFSHFVNQETLPLIKKATSFDSSFLEKGEVLGNFSFSEKEEMLQYLKLEATNFLIEASRKQLDKYYLDSLLKINKMIEAI